MLNNKILLKITTDSSGRPNIPGSTIKGVLSKNFLALSGSSQLTSELFGTTRGTAFISKVSTMPAKVIGECKLKRFKIERAWLPRAGRRNSVKYYFTRKTETDQYGIIEALPVETRLSFRLVGTNLEDFEIGGILMSLGLNHNNQNLSSTIIKMGWGKPQGFGQIKLEKNDIELLEMKMKGLHIEKVSRKNDIPNFIDSFKNKIKAIFPDRNVEKIYKDLFSWR
ncbi:MAG: RAMP superfamily CRISPR-associated protein [Promethearchaeota archaeon]